MKFLKSIKVEIVLEESLISQRKNIARSNSDLGAVTELGSKGDKMISKISE